MKNFRLTLKSDQGEHNIWTVAADKKSAIERIMAMEKCPQSAIKKVKAFDRIKWERVNNDVNGNPRFVCHFLNLIVDSDNEEIEISLRNNPHLSRIEEFYSLASYRAKKLGGRKYHTKSYGGGIVFQSYNIQETENKIHELLESI